MADSTFGVKVTDELKAELTTTMKESGLSGKEFMSMLLSAYKLNNIKEEDLSFQSDIAELQSITKRINGIFANMVLKTQDIKKDVEASWQDSANKFNIQIEELTSNIQEGDKEKENLEGQIAELNKQLEQAQKISQKLSEELNKQEDIVRALNDENKLLRSQLKNNNLLKEKYEEEIHTYEDKLNATDNLKAENEELNEELTKLKDRNDEVNSEVWFLKREIEKLKQEAVLTNEAHNKEINTLTAAHELKLNNALLTKELEYTQKINELNNKIFISQVNTQEVATTTSVSKTKNISDNNNSKNNTIGSSHNTKK